MATKIFDIFIKLFAIIVIFATLYILAVFIFPEIADNFGNKNLNEKIREIKEKSLEISKP